jgi:ribosomal protein S18 acetylase RimI-like enzyme
MNITIRRADENDIDAIYALSCAVHLSPLYQQLIPSEHRDEFTRRFTPNPEQLAAYRARFQRHLADPDWFVWVAEAPDGTICGFSMARQLENMFKLKGLFVSETYQGQGIGKQLFDIKLEAIRPDQPIVLDVIAANKRAINLYSKAGFHQTDFVPEPFYGAQMIRMQKY